MDNLNQHGQLLARLLQQARISRDEYGKERNAAEKVHIVGAGGTLTAAYEQLRNAAEYAEEHLLLERAIRRFYRRLFLLRDGDLISRSGDELAIELTLAGYVLNDSIPEVTVQKINNLASLHYSAYESLVRDKRSLSRAEAWTVEVLASEIEQLLVEQFDRKAFVHFAHQRIMDSVDFGRIFRGKLPPDIEAALFVAIHRALLKSDSATVRASLLERLGQSPRAYSDYIATNKQIDDLLDSGTVDKLFRYIDRHGAPLRVLRHLVDSNPDAIDKLQNKNVFLSEYEAQIERDYSNTTQKINRGIIKSVIFLIITKFLIGVGLEVPYDYLVAGTILWVPLIINLLFPPLYMVLLRATLLLPGRANTEKLVSQVEEMLYGDSKSRQLSRRQTQQFGVGYTIFYALAFVIVFGGVAWLLWRFFGFDIVHLLVFFVFLSAASFLGFRLSRQIRELESVDSDQNGVTIARDFLYMPFVVVGRYMSEKYAQVNIVAMTLDMLIELPLKTILRLIRQWSAFISSKKDQL
ncbi:hypothetical protein H6796_02370 [Candidatus Nomurabacteria bacterium]|nr:hypothetical protein [Candidatus Nomurabacteria bacterium]